MQRVRLAFGIGTLQGVIRGNITVISQVKQLQSMMVLGSDMMFQVCVTAALNVSVVPSP